jgi:acetylornithine/succinyldiaminopimelate/putrescine aminotransferase
VSAHHAFVTEGLEWCPYWPVFGPPQVMFVRGKGTELWDDQGRRYLDFLCGLAVTSLGHAHPVVAEALAEQSRTLLHVSNFFANPVATETAMMIDELLGGGGQVFFCNSGAEANEAAFAATGQPTKHEPFQPMPEGFRHVPFGDLGALADAVDPSVAAILIEPVQGEGGVVPAPEGYLEGIRELCDERGVLMVVDEVQTGFARTGRWFGFEHAGVRPDVVTMAKALGNGVPIGACWARRDVAAVLQPGDHGSTFSGTAIATAAARAVIAEMRRIDAPALARTAGARLEAALVALPGVVEVRGRGLLLAAELDGRDSKEVTTACLERGLVVNNVTPTAVRLAPPLTVSETEIDEAVAVLKDVLA